jgi:hypothetical protein
MKMNRNRKRDRQFEYISKVFDSDIPPHEKVQGRFLCMSDVLVVIRSKPLMLLCLLDMPHVLAVI